MGGRWIAACPEPACPQLVERKDFEEAVQEEASTVAAWQEQDPIPLVDDICLHLTSRVQTYSNAEEMWQQLYALEDLLVSIDLDC